jgi:hypothetical protein
VTYVTGSISLCELLLLEEPSLRGSTDEEVIMGASDKFTREVTSRGLSSTAVLIMGYRNEFTRGVLMASGSLIAVGILALFVGFGASVF